MVRAILIGGTGGQGIIAAGRFLSEALFNEGYEVVNSRSYGSEARGGRCRSEVLVSDSEIYDLTFAKADILILLSVPAFSRYQDMARSGALVLVDEAVLKKLGGEVVRPDVELVQIPASEIAKGLGNIIVANMVLLGALCKRSELISLDRIKDAVKAMMRPSMRAINMKALEAGFEKA
jgi:2-oxoglutarate ferredoxin oxidoreductase subunit gamma